MHSTNTTIHTGWLPDTASMNILPSQLDLSDRIPEILHGLLPQSSHTALLGITAAIAIVIACSMALVGSKAATPRKETTKHPPVAPYWIPFLGHLISWQRDSHALATRLLAKYGHATPFGLNIGGMKFYLVGEPKVADAMMKHNPGLSDVESVCFTLRYVFGSPQKVVKTMYRDDDSGPGLKPYPGSTTPSERRARYLQSKSARDNISGQNGIRLGVLYKDALLRNLKQDTVLNQGTWSVHADLWDFTYSLMFPAATEVIFGKRMLELNPFLMREIRGFLEDLPVYLGMWPRWLVPATYRRREAALNSIKRWLREVDEQLLENGTWNPDHGCSYITERRRFLSKFKEVDIEVEASETLGLFMALLPNSLGATYWTLFEVFSRPELVDRVRPICESAVDPLTGDIDSVQLSRSPLLQSILAEVLRIRVQGMIVRSTTRSVEVEGWTFPKHAYLMAPSNFGNFNESVWNTGTPEAPHPLDTFWPERFLIYPDDPTSGPLRTNQTTDTREKTDNSEGPKYSEHGLKGVYFPFGGSMHPCPGRQFSQFEVLNTLAILVLNYEVEICVEPGWTPKMKTKHFAFGTLPPAQQAPFRIRRKNVA